MPTGRSAPREAVIVRRIMRWLHTIPGCKAIKIHGSAYQEIGTPDIIGCINGRMFAIECKQPGKAPTPIQRKRLAEWQAAGAIVGVVHSLEEAKQVLVQLTADLVE